MSEIRICDTHAHYDDQKFDGDREKLLGELLPAAGVSLVVNVGAEMKGAEEAVRLAEKYEYVYAACGIHPDESGVFEEGEIAMCRLYDLLQHKKAAAVGEIGLDYHWMVEPKETQIRWFREQLRLAAELDLPVNVHSREAAQDTLDQIRENYDAGRFTGGIIHCYSGSVEMAREYVKMGYRIGIGGVVTFKNAKTLVEVVRNIPIEYLVTETDCPYLAPEPHRGQRNDSRYVRYVIEKIAELKQMDVQQCAEILERNAYEVYRISK